LWSATASASSYCAIAAEAALQDVFEDDRYAARRAPGHIGSTYVLGGFVARISVMHAAGSCAP
jgi:hypothetical protein